MTAGPVFNGRGKQIHPSEVVLARDADPSYARGARSPNSARGAKRPCARCRNKFQPTIRNRLLCRHCYGGGFAA